MLSLYFPLQIPLQYCFSQGTIAMICILGGWPQSYLILSEAVWTSMLHCIRSAIQFPREICSRIYSIALARYLRSLFLAFANFRLWLAIFAVLRLGKDSRYGFKFSRKYRRLAFVFSLLVRLIWFCQTTKLSKSILSNFKKWPNTIFALMYGGKPHPQECIFQRFRPSKITKPLTY